MKKFGSMGKIVLIIAVLFTLAGCSKANTASSVVEKNHVDVEIDKENVATSVYEKEKINNIEELQDSKIVDDPIYIAIDDLFLGTFEEGKWNSNQSLRSEYDSNEIKGINCVSAIIEMI
ncbi:MAG: hypothetical protein N4A64_12145 [Marinisporobacter sp.]|jgi:uncharacterized protein YceK|nr:hypothetical protein [Marinisporobacter sp.]